MNAHIELLQSELHANPGNWDIRMELVRNLAGQGHPQAALEVVRLAPPTAPPPPAFAQEIQALEFTAIPVVAPAPVLVDDARDSNRHNQRKAQISAFSVALLIHLVVAALLTLYFLERSPEEIPAITAIAAPAIEEKVTNPEITQSPKRKPPSSSSPRLNLVASSVTTPFSIPTVDEPVEIVGLGFGDGIGEGFGNSGGGAGGGGVTFFGNRSKARRVVFAVDVSNSMSNEQLALMKDELSGALNGLPASVNYQVIFFSGPAWYAHQEMEVKPTGKSARAIIRDGKKRYRWVSRTGRAHAFEFEDGETPLPISDWLPAKKANLGKTQKRIKKVERSFGTSWRVPLTLALTMKPKPDVIYFMTDGRVRSAIGDVDEITKLNKKTGKRTKIYTTSMMEPAAEKELKDLARQNGGDFSMVLPGGRLVDSRGNVIDRKKKQKK